MRVILAVDDSTYSQRVVEEVVKRQWPAATEFKILTVMEPLFSENFEADEWEELKQEAHDRRIKHANYYCSIAKRKLESEIEGAKVSYEIKEGDPKEQIVVAATDWRADTVLVGAHGKDICPHNLAGSVSRAVALHAPCSIEIIRPRSVHPAKAGHTSKAITAN